MIGFKALQHGTFSFLTSFFPHRTEYKAYRDVKPAKMIRARSQYLPPDEKTSLETSYSATFKGQVPLRSADNKALERRRIRSLYSEPYIDPIKQVRAHLSDSVLWFNVKGELQVLQFRPYFTMFSCVGWRQQDFFLCEISEQDLGTRLKSSHMKLQNKTYPA